MKVEESKQPEEKKENQKSNIDELRKIDVYQHLRRKYFRPKNKL